MRVHVLNVSIQDYYMYTAHLIIHYETIDSGCCALYDLLLNTISPKLAYVTIRRKRNLI